MRYISPLKGYHNLQWAAQAFPVSTWGVGGGGGVIDDDKQDGEQEENYDMFTIFRSLENCYIIY